MMTSKLTQKALSKTACAGPDRRSPSKGFSALSRTTETPLTSTQSLGPASRMPAGPIRRSTLRGATPLPVAENICVPRAGVDPLPSPATPDRSYSDGDNSLRLYLRDACAVPLLSTEDEVTLARRIKRGDSDAREQMIRANLRLVVKIAHDYEGMGMPILDLINEGNMGLMKAVERFDPAKGAKLSTYAAWWIKQAVKRALANQGKTIRIPVHLVDRIAKMRRVAAELHEELGRDPSDRELAEAMGMTRARVTELWQASRRPQSLDAPLSEGEDETPLAEMVRDDQMPTAFEHLAQEHTHTMLREFVDRLDKREETIIRYRFGLDGGPERTLEEVGHHFGVTRERIRQIQNSALAKLRKFIERRERIQDPRLPAPANLSGN